VGEELVDEGHGEIVTNAATRRHGAATPSIAVSWAVAEPPAEAK
jgi:hypothetical protein